MSNRKLNALILGVVAAINLSTIGLVAHEVTHQGTVVALKTGKYAQPTGGVREVQELEVTVADPKTKKPGATATVFTINNQTRLLRAGKRITVAEAGVQKGERVEVVVDHDKPGDAAIEIRLFARP